MLLLLLGCPPDSKPNGKDKETTESCATEPCDTGSTVAETCTPNAPVAWDGQVAYEERTTEWGLEGVQGVRFTAGDLDGDAYPDLVVWQGTSNARDDLAAGVQYHYVLMNREVEGRRSFVDETEASGLLQNRAGTEGISSNVHVLGDVDSDGDLDLYAGRYYDAGTTDATGDCSELYVNDGAGYFSLAPASDICDTGGYPTSGAAFTDFDADGKLDLWVVGFYVEYGGSLESANPELFRGAGDGTFAEVTNDAGLKLKKCGVTNYCTERGDRYPSYGATACDVNGDTLPDLIQSNYGRSWNNLFVNQGDGTFVETGEEANFASDDNYDYTDNTRYACWCETYGPCDPEPTVDCNGYWPPDYWADGYDDLPARNNGNSFTTVCADVDNDGDNDLYTTEIHHKWAGDSSDSTELLLNDGTGVFTRMDNESIGLARPRSSRNDWNEGDLYAAFLDFDSDGWKDILLGSSDYEGTQMWLWRQVAPGEFEDVSDETGMNQPWPAGIAVADFDLDGDLDVITGSSNARTGTPWTDHAAHLYENGLGGGNFVRVTGLPVGTRVDVTAGGVTQTQEVSGGYGCFGIQNDVPLTFGLGDVCLIDSVTVTKPGGESKTWENIAGNQARDLSF